MSKLLAIVMAAGHGTRMKSSLPKVLHPACGRPLVYFPVRAALDLGADEVIVVTNPTTREAITAELKNHLPDSPLTIAVQEVPQGTGDAARAGMAAVSADEEDRVLILSGDTPLLAADELRPLLAELEGEPRLSFMTFVVENPAGYGRVLRRDSGAPSEIREHKDLRSDAERAVREVNAGVYASRAKELTEALAGLSSDNAQGEFYLTDIVASISQSEKVTTVVADEDVLAGVNDRAQLRTLEAVLHGKIRDRLAAAGVSIVGNPLIDDTVSVGQDARIEDGVRLRGCSQIGAGTSIDVGTVVVDSHIGKNANIKPYCVVTESRVGDGVQLGPFAHIRPDSVLEDDCHIGNFVETKKTLVKKGAKANHLAYLGDAEVGEKSNLGAGTIICNYNGFQKQRTVIGKGVFVGSDSQLVAPVTLGDGAYVATATTVTKDVPAGALAIGRARQSNKEGYAEPLKARFKAAKEAELAKKESGAK